MTYKTLELRVKDRHYRLLTRMSVQVNIVWNRCCDFDRTSIEQDGKFHSPYDIAKYTRGWSSHLTLLPQQVINAAAAQMVLSRKHSIARRKKESKYVATAALAKAAAKGRKRKPSYVIRRRYSEGRNSAPGWIPVTSQSIKYCGGVVRIAKRNIQLKHRGRLGNDSKIKSGCFKEDARGRWFFCAVVEVADSLIESSPASRECSAVGIDPGCKNAFTTSAGASLTGRWYRDLEESLARAQRARRFDQAKSIHAKIAARRKDALHKFSRTIVNENDLVAIGNASSVKLAKTRLGKSVLDAGWGSFKLMLAYKCAESGAIYEEVNEAYSTVTCSACGERTGPTGASNLHVRRWQCTNCGVDHDRDINAAINILKSASAPVLETQPAPLALTTSQTEQEL